MKKLFYILPILSIFSCGRIPQPFDNGNIPHHIDPYFNPMIDRFRQDSEKADVGIGDFDRITVIEFDDKKIPNGHPEIGYCSYITDRQLFYNNFWKEIIFNDSFRNYSSELRYKIFLHELGHCAYHLSHDNSDANNIMNSISTVPDNKFYEYIYIFFLSAKDNKPFWFSEDSFKN